MSGYIINLVEFCFGFIFHGLSFARLLLIFHHKLKNKKKISPFMMALLLNWTLVCIFILIYEAHGIVVWRPYEGILQDGQWLYILGLPCHLFLAMIPVSIFFLTLDRIFIFYFGAHYSDRAKKATIYAYFATLFVCIIVCMFGFISALPIAKETDCEFFGCIIGDRKQIYLAWRAFCSIFNFISGVVFFMLLYKSAKQQKAFMISANNQISPNQRKNNNMAMLAIVSELILSFLPHFGPYIWEKIYGAGTTKALGPISVAMSSIDVLIFVSVYSNVLKSQKENSSLIIEIKRKEVTKSLANRIQQDKF